MKSHYELELEAEEERQNAPSRVHARIGQLTSLRDLMAFSRVASEAVMSVKLRKRIAKWTRVRLEELKGN